MNYLPALISLMLTGAGRTVLLFFLTLIFSIPMGFFVTLCAISKFKPLSAVANVYIWIMRGTPLMLQLFFMYFILPIATRGVIMLDNFSTATITFIMNYSAYLAEIYRGGIQSIDIGQYEAAKTLGFNGSKTMLHIIIPQTITRVLPAICNEAITLVKDTALISVIGAAEILKYAKDFVVRTSNPISYLVAACFYLFLTFIITVFARFLERKFSKYQSR